MHRTTTAKGPVIAYPTKIATCCYCGTRAALVMARDGRHELACSNCGAPLHDLKMLPRDTRGDRELVKPSALRQKGSKKTKLPKPAKKKAKRKKSRWGDLFEDAFDIIEDIFD
ncbi:MAG: hypothetical protein ABJ263_03780 [Tateyamaria sp.]|uniref:hypothetical protein n=1 Tax=Tateyamaria sp. TaxID=1929288 RepID=UPI003291642E